MLRFGLHDQFNPYGPPSNHTTHAWIRFLHFADHLPTNATIVRAGLYRTDQQELLKAFVERMPARKVMIRRTGRRLPKYPEPLWPFGALGRAWRRRFGATRLALYTTPTIGVVARKPEAVS